MPLFSLILYICLFYLYLLKVELNNPCTFVRCVVSQVGFLLLESLLLLGHFALFHLGNQAVLCWGKSPTIIHKVSEVFAFKFLVSSNFIGKI